MMRVKKLPKHCASSDREIYQEENKLKDLTAAERTTTRGRTGKSKGRRVQHVHSLKEEGIGRMYSDRLKKAIRYAVNREDHLRRFLTDGNIRDNSP